MSDHDSFQRDAESLPDDFFDRLSPSDFERETSAVREEPRKHQPFQEFATEGLDLADAEYRTDGESMDATAILENSTLRRYFVPDWDETNQMYVNRLTEEAHQFGATRFFVCGLGNALLGQSIDVSEPERLAEVLARSDLQRVINWYAEDTDEGIAAFGNIRLNDGVPALRTSGTDIRSASPLYRQVLGGTLVNDDAR